LNHLPSNPAHDVATPPARPEGDGRSGARPADWRLTAATAPRTPLTVKGLLDVVVLVVAAPVLLVPGVPARAYLIAAGSWIVLRAVGVAADRTALAIGPSAGEIGLRLAYLLGRLFALAVMVVLLRQSGGRPAALTALLVILVAFTIELTISAVYRPRRR
jgi:hypothetical protein